MTKLFRRLPLVAALSGGVAATGLAQSPHPISLENLRRRLAAFADDSMLGRETGTRANARAADYVARELARLRVKPAGDKGTFFQNVPMFRTKVDLDGAAFGLGGAVKLRPGVDFMPLVGHFGVPFGVGASLSTKQPLNFRGSLGDIADGKFIEQLRLDTLRYAAGVPDSMRLAQPVVVLQAAPRADGEADFRVWDSSPRAEQYRGATALLVESLDITPRAVLAELGTRGWTIAREVTTTQNPRAKAPEKTPPIPPVIAISRSVASALHVTPGGFVTIRFRTELSVPDAPTRNVVAMIEGSDPLLRAEVVVLSAHLDHLGVAAPAMREAKDSVMNGADVSGSGSVALLEIAEHLASLPEKPRRTIVFLWTVGEEQGMLGSQWFANLNACGVTPFAQNVALAKRDRCKTDGGGVESWIGEIVANINIDAIGRGGAADIEHGGPDYVQVIGATQLSDEFAHWVSQVTHDSQYGLRPDDEYDVTQPHKRASCTGDHWSFARLGIPSLFITTGDHADTRSVMDAPGTIDYDKLTKVTRLVSALAVGVANRDDRPALDDPVLGPLALCGQ